MDYGRLMIIYADHFWKNYKQFYQKLLEKIEQAYIFKTEWSRSDEKIRMKEKEEKDIEM